MITHVAPAFAILIPQAAAAQTAVWQVQSAGRQLQTPTPGGIASSFKLSLPK